MCEFEDGYEVWGVELRGGGLRIWRENRTLTLAFTRKKGSNEKEERQGTWFSFIYRAMRKVKRSWYLYGDPKIFRV